MHEERQTRAVSLLAVFLVTGACCPGMCRASAVISAAEPCALQPKTPRLLPIPERWNGINYFPRDHAFYNMLNDWFTTDRSTGLQVSAIVEKDLAMLAARGFNFLHLYVWDRAWYGIGFNPVGADPCASPGRQWEALDEYLSVAERHGLFVGIHFVALSSIKTLQNGVALDGAMEAGRAHYEWAAVFIKHLSRRHGNIILWGWSYALGPVADAGGESSSWNALFKTSYGPMYELARKTAPRPGLGLIGINLEFPVEQIAGEGRRYRWDAAKAQRAAMVVQELGLPNPDIYMVQLYNANSSDLLEGLQKLTGRAINSNGMAVPASKLLVVEFGTSTSLAEPPYGMRMGGWGDAWTPSLTLQGHAQWLLNTLCAFHRAGIRKMAHWTLYDAWDFWARPPFGMTGEALAWNGYWGLFPNAIGAKPKPSLRILLGYYQTASLSCCVVPKPAISLITDKNVIRSGEKVMLAWSATDAVSLKISPGVGAVIGTTGTIAVYPAGNRRVRYTLIARNEKDGRKITHSTSATVYIRKANPAMNRKGPGDGAGSTAR